MKKHWIQLSPYGTFPHPEGQQTLSISDAKRFVQKTNTMGFRFRLKKIPVYLGHPDDPLFQSQAGHCNLQVYGHVKQIRADHNGLSIQIKWTKIGRRFLLKNHDYYLSPRWVLSKTEEQNTYHPETLLSVGLTQHPNLPVQPIDPSTFLPLWKRIWKWLQQVWSKIFFNQHKKISSQNYTKNLPEAIPFPSQTIPLSSDLHGTQTREEKCRILNFGKQVQERMRLTGESYPEAWHALRQEKNLPSFVESAGTEEILKKNSEPNPILQPKSMKKNRSIAKVRAKAARKTSHTLPSRKKEAMQKTPVPNKNLSNDDTFFNL